MSRLARYRDSLDKFIKNKSCLFNKENDVDKLANIILYNETKNSDKTLSILLLTIMNNQNKKKNISMHGYYAAASIEFLVMLVKIINKKNDIINEYNNGNDVYNNIIASLITASNKSLYQNLGSVNNHLDPAIFSQIIIKSMEIYNDIVSTDGIINDFVFELSDVRPKSDTLKWYLTNDNIKNVFRELLKIKEESFNHYINTKIASLCKMAISIGWLIGCGDIKKIDKMKNLIRSFAFIYKISQDFQTIESDILNCTTNYSCNYVVNYGLYDSYETFMVNKQKFIEEAMIYDIYTTTVKEILSYIEKKVDEIIEQTSPDIKSNYSSVI